MLFIYIMYALVATSLSCIQTVESSSAQLPPPAVADTDLLVSPQSAVLREAPSNKNIQDNTAEQIRRASVVTEDPPFQSRDHNIPAPAWVKGADNKEQLSSNGSGNNVVQSREIRQEPVAEEVISTPLEDSIINRHRKLFRQAVSHAKTFSSNTEAPQKRNTASLRKAHSAKTFEIVAASQKSIVRDWRKDVDESTTANASTDAKITDIRQETARGAKPLPENDMCTNCPTLMMNTKIAASDICENWEAISSNFEMTMDKVENATVQDKSELFQCKRSITCKEPHVIVKWLDYNLCDVHKAESGETFNYSCNGTHWFMKDFPIEQIICASNNIKEKGSS